ncbi:Dabb family protein [Wenxinia saemankumensis]|uniref:Stress responsive A/B Barrel Domain n=1 Tax=Wenxinia saemankumensis TaxID=1447782 RepID=A0A1M6EIE8_9RHOB|nr:Dabb family protein [Wenxinia saemankumensis]SHI85203.1 Stress responsive A/B Barrel Domain [Wenxinia saemankumensis]
MIRHLVCLRPTDEEAARALPRILADLGALTGEIEGFVAFAGGPNIDAEGLSPGITHLFSCDFADRAALDRYAADPRHRALGARLVEACGPGGITVYDMEIAP